jgi:CelD/BcsL family acetyltransferase involved in cellulose biosynthesis
MDIELVTDVDRLEDVVAGWEALADRVSEPRAGGAVVAGWARHMMGADSELRIWIALDGSEVVGVLPFVTERMPRERLRLVPPATDMMYGIVPIADPDRADHVVAAIADDFAARTEMVDMTTIYWLPEGSPWTAALGNRLGGPDWVTAGSPQFCSYYTDIGEGVDAWLAQRDGDFRREVRRRARRGAEQGFRIFTTVDPAEIARRLPLLKTFYLRRKEERGGAGYRFDDDMCRAIESALHMSTPGRFGLSVLERDDLIIGLQFALRSGTKMSSWMTGFDPDPQWSRLGTGIATLLEALDAGAGAGCEIVDLGVGDEPYKETFRDGQFPLESVTWCRPRLARLVRFEADPGSA